MDNKTTLEIVIENAEFAKEFNYFITIQLDNNSEKRRTDVSESNKNPVFTNNKFYLQLEQYDLLINQRINFAAFIVVERPENLSKEGDGSAKLLGESILELAPLTERLNNLNNISIRQKIDLVRRQNDSNAVVGRINLSMKLLSEALIPDDNMKNVVNDHASVLPEFDVDENFTWRLRVELRSAINLPFNRTSESKLPTTYLEIGWTLYQHEDLNVSEAVRSSSIESNRFPIWNQQLLYYPPTNVKIVDGFINVLLKDIYQVKPIQKFTFPLNTLRPFHPAHLDLLLDTEDEDNRSHLYISFTMEESPIYKMAENLVNIIVNNINFDPLPQSTNRASVMMTTDNWKPDDKPNSPYKQADLKSDNHLSNVLLLHKNDPYSVFLTSSIKIPPVNLQNQYGAISCFIVPKSFLDRELKFFLILKNSKLITNHSMPNCNAGYIEVVDDLIKTSYYSKSHERVPFKVSWSSESIIYSSILHTRCIVELSLRPVEILKDDKNDIFKKDLQYTTLKDTIIKSAVENYTVNLSNVPDKEKWDILSKELSQKQELIHRMMKEVDEKSESLKLTGSEIIELRKQIKLLQSENTILRKRLGQEEQMQIESLVTQEIHKMSLPELKSKIIKLAQAYRGERMRNEEFEKALKQAQIEITNARKISYELEQMQKQHEEDTQKFLNLQKETQKISLYRETIKKQELVIQKYESLLKKSMTDSNRQKEGLMELEQLRTENLKLQKELKDLIINSVPGTVGKTNPEIEKYRKEVDKLESIIKELRDDLKSKRPLSSEQKHLQTEILELEVKFHKAQSRVRALEDEIQENSKRYAQEISRLKIILSEKESIIETLRMENI